jgi:hypothetical protein
VEHARERNTDWQSSIPEGAKGDKHRGLGGADETAVRDAVRALVAAPSETGRTLLGRRSGPGRRLVVLLSRAADQSAQTVTTVRRGER